MISDLNNGKVSENLTLMELNSVIKPSPPVRKRMRMSNENALWPTRTVQTGFVVFEAAAVELCLRKVKNSVIALCKVQVVTG